MLGQGLHITKRNTTVVNRNITPSDLAGLSLWMDADDTTTVNAKLAASFASANSEYLSSSDAVFKVGDEDFSFGGWVYYNALGGNNNFCSVFGNVGNRSYFLYKSSSNIIQAGISSDGGTSTTLCGTTSVSASTWYFIVMSYDSVSNLIKVSVNGAAFESNVHVGGASPLSTALFCFGSTNGSGNYHNGRMDSCFFYKKALTQAQVEALYNSGNGVAYENLTADQLISLTAWWSLNERSGNRADEHGGYTLTDNNTVTYALGKVIEPIEANEYVFDWIDKSDNLYVLSQNTALNQPQWKSSGFGVNSKPYISFDGSDSLSLTIANIFSGHSQGTMIMVYQCTDISSQKVAIISSSDTVGANNKIAFYDYGLTNGYAHYPAVSATEGGSADVVRSSNLLNITDYNTYDTVVCILVVQSNGTSYTIKINNNGETSVVESGSNSGAWFADISGRDNIAIGAEIDNTPTYFPLNIAEIVYSSNVLSESTLKKINQYFIEKYGIFSNAWGNDYSLNFALGDYLESSTSYYNFVSPTTAFSVSAWVKVDSVTGTNGVLELSDFVSLAFLIVINGQKVTITFDDSFTPMIVAESGNIITTPSQWYNVVVTYDGTNDVSGFKLYVNGALVTLNNIANTPMTAYVANYLFLGYSPLLGAYDFNGKMNSVTLYDTELNQSAVTGIYNGGIPKNEIGTSNLKSYFQMGQNASLVSGNWVIPDLTGRSPSLVSVTMDYSDRTTDVPS